MKQLHDQLQRASSLSFTPCTTTNNVNPFWLSGATKALGSGVSTGTTALPTCPITGGFLIIANALDTTNSVPGDRFCGTALSALIAGETTSRTVLSKFGTPFL